jgi:hypothetical protein
MNIEVTVWDLQEYECQWRATIVVLVLSVLMLTITEITFKFCATSRISLSNTGNVAIQLPFINICAIIMGTYTKTSLQDLRHDCC